MEILGYLAAVLMGVTLAVFGGGGSILTVPILVYLFAVTPVLATAYSLLVVGLTSLVGAVSYHRQRLIRWKVAFAFAAPALVGVFLVRRFVIPVIPVELFQWGDRVFGRDHLIMTLFALLMTWAAVAMLRPRVGHGDPGTGSLSSAAIAFEGLVVGAVTGLVGAGGGFLIIPALVLLARVPMKEAVGTSLVIIALKSLFGFLGDAARFSQMDFRLVAWFLLASIVGVLAGSLVSRRIPVEKLKPAFGVFLLVMGAAVFWQTFVG